MSTVVRAPLCYALVLVVLVAVATARADVAAALAARCGQVALFFSDARWRAATESVVREWLALGRGRQTTRDAPHCALVHWWDARNESEIALCAQRRVWCATLSVGATRSQPWGTARYFARIAERLPRAAALLDALPLHAARGVQLFDSDVVLWRDIGARAAHATRNATLVVQQEWPCQSAPATLCVNGGVWWVRRSAAGRALLREAVRLMRALRVPDQDALQIVAARAARGAVHFWPRATHANGAVALRSGGGAAFDPRRAHLAHANWLRTFACKQSALRAWRSARRAALAPECTWW